MTDLSMYRRNALAEVPADQLLLRLYERAITDMDDAERAMRDGARMAWIEAINHARAIVVELQLALDHTVAPALARSLHEAYAWMRLQLGVASRAADIDLLRAVRAVTAQLYETWRQVVELAHAAEAPSVAQGGAA